MNGCEVIASFLFPKWRRPPSWIFKICKFCSCKISSRSDERLPRYCNFSISNMAAVRHLGFLKYANFWHSARFAVTICVFLQNFVVIGWTVPELLQVFDFQNGGCPPSWIFKICKFLPSARFVSWSAFSRKISSRSDERLRSYCKFSISKMAYSKNPRWRRAAISEIENLQ